MTSCSETTSFSSPSSKLSGFMPTICKVMKLWILTRTSTKGLAVLMEVVKMVTACLMMKSAARMTARNLISKSKKKPKTKDLSAFQVSRYSQNQNKPKMTMKNPKPTYCTALRTLLIETPILLKTSSFIQTRTMWLKTMMMIKTMSKVSMGLNLMTWMMTIWLTLMMTSLKMVTMDFRLNFSQKMLIYSSLLKILILRLFLNSGRTIFLVSQ